MQIRIRIVHYIARYWNHISPPSRHINSVVFCKTVSLVATIAWRRLIRLYPATCAPGPHSRSCV